MSERTTALPEGVDESQLIIPPSAEVAEYDPDAVVDNEFLDMPPLKAREATAEKRKALKDIADRTELEERLDHEFNGPNVEAGHIPVTSNGDLRERILVKHG